MADAMRFFPGITNLSNQFKGILLDAYGVFWGGNDCGLLPGSKESMEQMVSNGKIVGILSNSTQLESKEKAKLQRSGIVEGKHFHFLTTSGEVARDIFFNEKLPFATPKNTYWLFGGAHPKFSSHEAIFQGTVYSETPDIHEADFIYASIPHVNGEDQIYPEIFREGLEKIDMKNLPMVCTNPDRFAHEGNPPRAVVRQGSIAKMFEEMGGHVLYIGKPHRMAFAHAMLQFQKHNIFQCEHILMVGDNPETDIRGARCFGMPSALVTQTGIMAENIFHKGLKSALQSLPPQDLPDYSIGRLIDDL